MTHKIKKAILKVEQWSYNWGFKLSTIKSCYILHMSPGREREMNRGFVCVGNQRKK